MCFGSPRAPIPIEPVKPEVLHNPFLDGASSDTRLIKSLRQGRSALRIRLPGLDTIGFGGLRSQAAKIGSPGKPSGNAGARGRGPRIGGGATPTEAQARTLAELNTPYSPHRLPQGRGHDNFDVIEDDPRNEIPAGRG